MTYRTIGLEIEDDIYQAAVSRAVTQGKTINQILVDLLETYAGKITVSPTPTVTLPIPKPISVAPVSKPTAPIQSTYVVQSGDTLGAIAKKMYGSATKYFTIQKANNITDPRRIWVGQTLVIPAPDGGNATTTTAPSIPPPVTPTQPATTIPDSIPVPPTSGENPRPAIRFVGSPNFNGRPRGEISAIVMHATANGNLDRVVDWFNKSSAQVSAHYTIGKDGTIVQHVRDEHRAWHAGQSEWQGRTDLNSWSIGIELVNWNNGEDPFPEAQHQAAVDLGAYLCHKYGIKPEMIVAHYDVAPQRKTDPRGYDMERLRREISARL